MASSSGLYSLVMASEAEYSAKHTWLSSCRVAGLGERGEGLRGIDGLGLRPALLAPYRDLGALRHDFPLVLVDGVEAADCVRPLAQLVDEMLREVAPRGIEGERLRCPCCGESWLLAEQPALLAAEQAARRRHPGGSEVLARARRTDWPQWACADCLAAGRALLADVTKQSGIYDGPHVAYLPVRFDCHDCGQPFTFTPQRQRQVRRAVVQAHLGAGTITAGLWGALADDQAATRLDAAIAILTLQG